MTPPIAWTPPTSTNCNRLMLKEALKQAKKMQARLRQEYNL